MFNVQKPNFMSEEERIIRSEECMKIWDRKKEEFERHPEHYSHLSMLFDSLFEKSEADES